MGSLTVYTDGGCSGNPGPGAWAFVIATDGEPIRRSGGTRETTNNRMELSAVIKALEYVSGRPSLRSETIEVFTDSQYVKKGMTEWIKKWQLTGWKSSTKKPVKNQDLWKRLLALSDGFAIRWNWVPGHSGLKLNELCDSLVGQKIREIVRAG